MLSFHPTLEFERNPKCKFWLPPYKFLIPPAPPGHTYIPISEFLCSEFYMAKPLIEYPELLQSIPPEVFQIIISNSNNLIRKPYLKYRLLKVIMFLMIIFYTLRIFNYILFGIFSSFLLSLAVLILVPFGMRLGGKQHLERLKKYERVMNKYILNPKCESIGGSGYIVEVGEMCLYLDFHQGIYTEDFLGSQRGKEVSTTVVILPENELKGLD